MALGTSPAIGLDIGSSAVRAAQITSGRSGRTLARFGQVALPPGAVQGGEVRDPEAVAEAIAQLWKRSKFSSKKVVLGVANQRVVVRQLDMPYIEEKELRNTLRFQVADQIPMPVEDAELDFQILGDYTNDDGVHMMKVLLVAAATDMVESFLDVISTAGLRPEGVDLAPFAVARAVSAAARGETGVVGAEAIIDIGAGVTNIVIHQNGEARFVRILLIGGDDATNAISEEMDVPFDEAEAMKLDLSLSVGPYDAKRALEGQVENLVQEIQGSLDYYGSLEDSETVTSVLLTGGGSLVPGLVQGLEMGLQLPIQRASALNELNVSKSKLTEEQVPQVDPVAAAAVGLATGGSGR